MFQPSIRTARTLTLSALVMAGSLMGGCDFIEAFKDDGGLVNVYTTHHATPEAGAFPDRGGADKPRLFQNDEGWDIVLTHAYVTTVGASLLHCDGSEMAVELYWGQLPESLAARDLQLEGVGGVQVPPGEYCGVAVEYGPYQPGIIEEGDHDPPSTDRLDDATVYMRGSAQKDGVHIQFEYALADDAEVDLDMTHIMNGRPLRIADREPFPLDLTVSKTYDRFFDGLDFNDPTALDILQEQTLYVLEDETRITLGTTPRATDIY